MIGRKVFSFWVPWCQPTWANRNTVYQILSKFSLFLTPVWSATLGKYLEKATLAVRILVQISLAVKVDPKQFNISFP